MNNLLTSNLQIYLYFIIPFTTWSQTIVQLEFNGLSPEQFSPYLYNVKAKHGLQNPERGFEVKGGIIDVFTNSYQPDINMDYSYKQYQEKSDLYYENVIDGDPNINKEPLSDYLNNFYCEDGISLVEIEEYVNFTQNNLVNQNPLRPQDIINANSVFEILPSLGVKAHLVMNSSYQIFSHNLETNGAYMYPYHYLHKNNNPTIGAHTLGLSFYLNQMSQHYQQISPYVANVHLGWIYSPHDLNTFRHSGKWQKSSLAKFSIYPTGLELNHADALPFLSNNVHLLKNEYEDFRESKQKFDWGVAHAHADAHQYNSTINQIRGMVIDHILSDFPHQKILLNSMYPWTNYLGLKEPMYTTITNNTNALEPQFDDFYSGNNLNNYPYWSQLLTHAPLKRQRIGYYDGFFGGDTYSHAWTIGNGETQQIHWHHIYFNYGDPNTNLSSLGQDWADNKMHVDSYLLRKYRENLWVHGELPVFETTDINTCAGYGNPFRSFTSKYYGMSNWLEPCESTDPVLQYPWQLAEAMTDGRLQNGFKSALKMRYFNFTSFNIGHNHLLDGRSPYEFKHLQPTTWTQSYPGTPLLLNPKPDVDNTVVSQWKVIDDNLLTQLDSFNMPISDLYFGVNENYERSAYAYIRDHLGYRLELQKAKLEINGLNLFVNTLLINRGFSAPQNPRPFYFVILDYNTNTILKTIPSNVDWRTWQPDHFATGIDNQNDVLGYSDTSIVDGLNSIANSKVGGIPLGDYKSNWHHTSLNFPYMPYQHSMATVFPFNFNSLPIGQYKIGIWAPDPSESLENHAKYNVKFANQLSYIHSNGVNIIGSVTKTSTGLIPSSDLDADGIPNNIDNHPNNPIDYNGGHPLLPSNSCFGFTQVLPNSTCKNY